MWCCSSGTYSTSREPLINSLNTGKMAVNSQTTSLMHFLRWKLIRFEFHWNVFLKVQLAISQYWYRTGDIWINDSLLTCTFIQWGIHRGPVNSPHKWPLTRKMFPFDDVIMLDLDEVLCCLLWCRLQTLIYPYPLLFSLNLGRIWLPQPQMENMDVEECGWIFYKNPRLKSRIRKNGY